MPAGTYDLADLGYVEEEFLLEGTADSYRLVGEREDDGRWKTEPSDRAPFTTRVLVRRPVDPERFSGTVVVEWNNVSGGVDIGPDWSLLHRHLIRRGHAWVGVTAQKAGIDGGGLIEGPHLKKAFPERYAVLSHPGRLVVVRHLHPGRPRRPRRRRPARARSPRRGSSRSGSRSRRPSSSPTSTRSTPTPRSTTASSCTAEVPAAPRSTGSAWRRPTTSTWRVPSRNSPARRSATTSAFPCSCCRARPTSRSSAAAAPHSATTTDSGSGRSPGRRTPTPTS